MAAAPDVLVVGAGLGGATVARRLADSGLRVEVIDRSAAPGGFPVGGASRNRRALVQPYLTRHPDEPYAALLSAGWDAFERRIARCPAPNPFHRSGVLTLPATGHQRRLFDARFLPPFPAELRDAADASEIAGCPLADGGWWLPDAGTLDPRALVTAELANIPCHFDEEVTGITAEKSGIRVTTTRRTVAAGTVVLASSWEIARLPCGEALPVEAVHGEALTVTVNRPPHVPLCGKGYVLPLGTGECLVGARYKHGGPLDTESEELVEVAERLCGLGITGIAERRQAYRCSTHDRCPYVGPLTDFADLLAQKETVDFRRSGRFTPRPLPNVYVSAGFGSRGVLLSSLAAEILAERIVHGRAHPLESRTTPERAARYILFRPARP